MSTVTISQIGKNESNHLFHNDNSKDEETIAIIIICVVMSLLFGLFSYLICQMARVRHLELNEGEDGSVVQEADNGEAEAVVQEVDDGKTEDKIEDGKTEEKGDDGKTEDKGNDDETNDVVANEQKEDVEVNCNSPLFLPKNNDNEVTVQTSNFIDTRNTHGQKNKWISQRINKSVLNNSSQVEITNV